MSPIDSAVSPNDFSAIVGVSPIDEESAEYQVDEPASEAVEIRAIPGTHTSPHKLRSINIGLRMFLIGTGAKHA